MFPRPFLSFRPRLVEPFLATISRVRFQVRGFRLQALSFRFQARSFRLQALSFRFQARSFRLQARSFRLQARSFRFQAQGFRLQAQGFRFQAQTFRRPAQGFRRAAKRRRHREKTPKAKSLLRFRAICHTTTSSNPARSPGTPCLICTIRIMMMMRWRR
jgi:hypothetical protein